MTLQNQMNQEIDALIANLQFAKSLPGFRTKVSTVDRVADQVQNFVLYWDLKLDKIHETEI